MLLRRPRTVSSFFWIPVYDLISQVYNGWRHITLPPVLTPSWSSWARASDTITKPYRARLKPKGQWWARPPSKGGGGEVGGEEWKERRKRGTCGGSRLRRWSLEKRPCSARMKGLNATQRSGSGLRIPPLSLPSYFSFLFFSFLLSLLPASSRGSALFSAGVNGLKSGGWSSGPDQDHGGCVPSESRMGGTGQWKFVLFLVSVFH